MVSRRRVVVAGVFLVGLFAIAPLLRPAHATSPGTTNHDTKFDNIAPRRGLFQPLPFGGSYVPGSVSPCNSFIGLIPGVSFPQWVYVGEQPQTLKGQVTGAPFVMTDDNPFDHHSRDRNFYVHPDDNSAQLLAAPGNFQTGEQDEQGRIEVEWEAAAFPAWAEPAWGDAVQVEGGHIWDCAHADVSDGYRTEIHPPLVVMALRDAAKEWSSASATIPARPGWVDTMPDLGSVPVPVTRADVFGSSDGGEALEQENCFYHPCSVPDWYQPLAMKNYDFFVPAPPKPDAEAQIVMKLTKRPFPHCDSDDNSCGEQLDVLKSTSRITFTKTGAGVNVHVNFDGFTEPASLLYGFGFTLEVGWNRPATVVPKRVKVTVEKVHIETTMDDAGNGPAAEWEIFAMIGGDSDHFRHLLLTDSTGDGVGYEYNEDVPATNDVDTGDYGIKGSGTECALDADSGADPGPCEKTFEVTLLPGEPLHIYFRAEEADLGLNFNNDAGTIEHIVTDNYAFGERTEWFQELSSAGVGPIDGDCNPDPCASLTYKVENDPIPVPPGTTLSTGPPTVAQGGETWVRSASPLGLTATAAAGDEADLIEIHARFWRTGTQAPPETTCGSGTGTATCTLHLDKQDGADGQYTVEYWGVDATKGSIEPTHTASFRLDNTAPTSSAALAGTLVRGWYNTPVTVTLSASDGAGVGVGSTIFDVDAGPFGPYTAPFQVTGDSAAHHVSFASLDKLSNAEPLQGTQFQLDATAPTLTIGDASDGTFHYTQDEVVNGLFTNGSSLQIDYASSDALSGMWQARLDGTPIGFTGTTSVSIPAGISTHSLVAEDVAGNLKTLTFAIVSVTPFAKPDPLGAGSWKNMPADATLLDMVNIVSRAFGAPTNRYADVTTANYQSYLTPGAMPLMDQKVARELLVAWLNLVSGREPAARAIDLKTVQGWWNVVTNTGGQNGSSATTALNLVRESERRLEDVPPTPYLDLIQTLLEKLNADKLK